MREAIESEVTVVGTGFGGAVAACRLSQAGMNVLVLERGRRFEAQDFPPLPADSALLPDTKHWAWQGDHGLWDVEDLEEIVSVQAAGYGGGSLIYANVHLRPPGEVFADKWPKGYDLERLAPFYDLAAYMLDATPISESALFHKLVKTEQLRKVAAQLGREDGFFYPPLAVNYNKRENAHGKVQKECNGCGRCCTGCPETAKNTLDYNYLAVAEKFGARVRTQFEVIDIEELPDGAGWQLSCVDHVLSVTRVVKTKTLFLSAGAVHSSRLLSRAKLLDGARATQERVGVGYFPNADALGIIYDTEHPQYPSCGPTITNATVHWSSAEKPSREPGFFMIQDGGYAREVERLAGTLRARLWTGRNRLTGSGPAQIAQSELGPLPAPKSLQNGHAAPAQPSIVDSFLLAALGGAFKDVASDDLRAALPQFLEEVKALVLLPELVDNTIEQALQAKFSWLPTGLRKLLVRGLKWFAYFALGNREKLADDAFKALTSGSGLGPDAIAARVLGYDAARADHRVVLLGMGRDRTRGVLHYDANTGRMIADLDLFHLAPRYTAEELMMSDMAQALGGELRVNPAWSFLGKPITVHSHGGCRMSDDPAHGVTDANGRVHGCQGLYVCDGSVLCASVGVNPSATITAIAERNVLAFIRQTKANWPTGDDGAGAQSYAAHVTAAESAAETAKRKQFARSLPRCAEVPLRSRPLTASFSETMQGFYAPGTPAPDRDTRGNDGNEADPHPEDDELYRIAEIAGRPGYPLEVQLKAVAPISEGFYEDENHSIDLSGTIRVRLPGEAAPTARETKGTLSLFVPRYKPYALEDGPKKRAQEASVGTYKSVKAPGNLVRRGEPPPCEERLMKYDLRFEVDRKNWALHGYKRMSLEPGVNAWRDTTSLFVTLLGPDASGAPAVVAGIGAIHVDLTGFLFGQLHSVTVSEAERPGDGASAHRAVDPARLTWSVAKFSTFFFGSLQRIYVPEVGAVLDTLFHPRKTNVNYQRR
ncbi:MAG TPA: GMC oxidoreductase [Polyangiaceae bacterium]